MVKDNTELFARMPVRKAIISLVIPTIISQMITVIYNMADTFFIGQMNDPDQVAAATLAMPPFVMMTGLANLFGIGGASLISRCLGAGNKNQAQKTAAFSIWGAGAVALIYGLTFYLLRPILFPILGTDASTYDFASSYALWCIAIGGVPTVLSATFAHLVRAEGYSKESSFGVLLGGVLNIILDPIFIFTFGLGVAGAAIATMLSNFASLIYFLILINKNKGSVISLSPKNFTLSFGIPKEVMLVGFPSFMMMLMGTFSNILLNKLVVGYSNEAIAGMGIAKKIDMLAFAIANGMTQGVLPLIGYNFAAKNRERLRSSIKSSFVFSLIVAILGALFLFFLAVPIMKFFINDAETVAYGQHFLKVICVTCPAISITMMIISIFQATGLKAKPMVLSFLRKGSLDVPFMFIMDSLLGADGIPWATPISDLLALITALLLFIPYWKKIKSNL